MDSTIKEERWLKFLQENQKVIGSVCLFYAKGDTFYFSDLMQETSIAVWLYYDDEGCARFQQKCSNQTWAYILTRNVAVTYLRKYGSKLETVCCDFQQMDDSVFPSDQDQEEMERLEELLAPLSKKEREMILLKYVEGFSFKEIAEMKKMSLPALRLLNGKIKEKIKKARARNDAHAEKTYR